MENITTREDLSLTHTITNYLNSVYQGKFAALNILSQLGYEKLNQQELMNTRSIVNTISEWNSALWRRTPLFYSSWSEPQTAQAHQALKFLSVIKIELTKLADLIEEVCRNNTKLSPEQLQLLVGSFGRFAYSRDNYIRGFLEYGKVFNVKSVVKAYEPFLPEVTEEIRYAHMFLNTLKQSKEPDEAFYLTLKEHAIKLPGTFRAQNHDITILLSIYAKGLSYSSAGFSHQEADYWKAVGIGPVQAGYWNSQGFLPEEAARWLNAGCPDHWVAAEWKQQGFTAQNVLEWVELGLTAFQAKRWKTAGYKAPRVQEFLQQGITDPHQVTE